MVTRNLYIDESIRDSYILCSVAVQSTQVSSTRSALKKLREPGRSSIHMQKETRTRQIQISEEISTFNCQATIIEVSLNGLTDLSARLKALEHLFSRNDTLSAQLITFDASNSVSQDNRLLSTVLSSTSNWMPHYRHLKFTYEPLLWLPDIIAWCYGRGGTWRDAVEPLVTEVIEI